MTGDYAGPLALRSSKYASRLASPPKSATPSFPSAAPSPFTRTNGAANGHRETSGMAQGLNPDAQLAITQNEALREEVQKQITNFTKSMATAVTNTRRLLELLRDFFRNDGKASGAELKTIDELWGELERFAESGKMTAALVPQFLEKQESNMKLYHNSVINETFRSSQDELNQQHKKVNVQHSLILEHQEAFMEYQQQIEGKLKELADLQERASRLTLDKGLLKSELDKYRVLLDEAKAAQVENTNLLAELQKELQTALKMKRDLSDENETLRNAVTELQNSKAASEEGSKAQKEMTEVLARAAEDKASLEKRIDKLRASEGVLLKQMEQRKDEHDAFRQKFNNQSTEYSRLFTESSVQATKIDKLTGELDELKKDNAGLKKNNADLQLCLGKLAELEKEKAALLKTNMDMKKLIESLERDAAQSKKLGGAFESEAKATIQKLEKQTEELEIENNDLLAQVAVLKRKGPVATPGLEALKEENAKLQASLKELQAAPKSHASDTGASEALKEQLKESDEKLELLQNQLAEWQELAKTTYNEYKDILPTYKEAEQLKKDCAAKDEQIKKLTTDLQTAKTSRQANGKDDGTSVAYWKTKYETLLANLK